MAVMIAMMFGAPLSACDSRSNVAEKWTFNPAGDLPDQATDEIELQPGLADDRALDTVSVDNVTAVLPDGTELQGFASVDVQMDGTDTDSPLILARFQWPAQERTNLAETAKGLATQLGMEPERVDQWGTRLTSNTT